MNLEACQKSCKHLITACSTAEQQLHTLGVLDEALLGALGMTAPPPACRSRAMSDAAQKRDAWGSSRTQLLESVVATRAELQCQLVNQLSATERTSQDGQQPQAEEPGPLLESSSSSSSSPKSKRGRAASGRLARSKKEHSKKPSVCRGNATAGLLPRSSKQPMQVPAILQYGLLALFLQRGLDLGLPTMSGALVLELNSLQQLAVEEASRRSPDSHRLDCRASSPARSAAANASQHHGMPAGKSKARQSSSSIAASCAAASAEHLLERVYPACTHPVQHAHVLVTCVEMGEDASGAGQHAELSRLKEAAVLLDSVLAKASFVPLLLCPG